MPEYSCPKCDAGVSLRSRNQVPRRITCPSCRHRFPAKGNEGSPHGVPGFSEGHHEGGSLCFKSISIVFGFILLCVVVIYILNTTLN